MDSPESPIILDACCLLNFYASARFLEILKAIPAQFTVTLEVKEKELQMFQALQDNEKTEVNLLEIAIAQNLLKVIDFESEEEAELFVNYAQSVDDGEAATGAIAVSRGWAIATDDKRAIKFFQREVPKLQIFSTLELIKYWSDYINLDELELQEVLNAIRVEGKYIPDKKHPLYNWWESVMKI